MRAILAIARAEVLRNWKIIAVPLSAVVGVFVLAALGTKVSDRDFRGSLMGILIVSGPFLTAVTAAVLGLNLFGPDIRQRRLSFFLTRPCAPWQLWLGRLTGAAAIVGVGWLGVLATVPFSGFNGGRVESDFSFIIAAVLAGVLLVMNAIAMILAANSARWFIADVVAAIVFLAVVVWSAGRTLALGDVSLIQNGFYAITFGGLVALFLGGLAFLAAGHGEGPSGQRAHSLTIWSIGVLVLAGLGVERAYEWNRPLGSRLSHPFAKAMGHGEAVITVFGKRGAAAFLLETRTGRARRVSGFLGYGFVRNAESGLVGFVEPRLDPASAEHGGPLTRDVGVREGFISDHLVISSLDSGRPPIVDRPIPSRFRALMDISPSGDLAIFSTSGGLTAIRAQTGATAFDQPASNPRWAHFQSESTILALDSDGSAARLRILGLDGKLIEERRFPVTTAVWSAAIHTASGRVAVAEPQHGWVLYDRDGHPLVHWRKPHSERRTVGPMTVLFTRAGDFLEITPNGLSVVRPDESMDELSGKGSGNMVEIEKNHLIPLRMDGLAVPLGGDLRINGELESGEVVISQHERNDDSILLVEPKTGEVHVRLKGLRPLGIRRDYQVFGSGNPSDDSTLRLFRNDDGDLVYLDPGSKTPRLLVKNTSEDR